MRLVRYRLAASLDGYIAGPRGEIDWIVPDPTVDFAAIFAGFDTALLGRHTYELTLQPGAPPWPPDWRIYVFSRTLNPPDHPSVKVISSGAGAVVRALRTDSGRDIWLFGGGQLFASLLAEHAVDQVEVATMPVLLGGGVPLAAGAPRCRLRLIATSAAPSGIVNSTYAIDYPAG
jgi:dihydrofolate reductase